MADPTQEKFKPADEYVVSDLDTLKVLADPLRLSIIELLNKPNTVKQVAAQIDKPPTKLYYHFNLLEKHDLITMVDTRIVSGIVEKHYQATAKSYRVDHNLLSPGQGSTGEGLEMTMNAMFESAREDVQASMRAGIIELGGDAPRHRRLAFSQRRLLLKEAEAEEFYQRLRELLDEFANRNTNDDDAPVDPVLKQYKMLLLLHPSGRKHAQAPADDEIADIE